MCNSVLYDAFSMFCLIEDCCDQTDYNIGQIVKKLDATGNLKMQTAVVVFGDHGARNHLRSPNQPLVQAADFFDVAFECAVADNALYFIALSACTGYQLGEHATWSKMTNFGE